MTGFARASGEINTELRNICWQFEIKSVNGKSLDIKIKLPPQYEELSFELKKIASQYLQRGSVSVFLDIKSTQNDAPLYINEELLNSLTNKAIDLYKDNRNDLEKPRSSDLLAMKGVVEIQETPLSETETSLIYQSLKSDFEKLCQNLVQDRKAEGEKIKIALLAILDKIKTITANIEQIAETLPEKIKSKLNEQISFWLSDTSISEDRLAQEVVFYITRADIREEIDRLKAHIKTATEMLNCSEAIGRRLDFLCQELNREANTTCSKSFDIELTSCGMELKALIEQFREQIQNIE